LRSDLTEEQIQALRQENIGRLFLRAHRAFGELAYKKLHDRGHDGLSIVHTALLAHLDMHGTQVTTLADRAGITKQAMGRLVDELEGKGYVESAPDPADGRAKRVTFTERGWQFLTDAYEVKLEIEAIYTSVLGEEGMTQLRDSLEKVAEITSSKSVES
jgi:DNA-binding MarR family transcriptional regulator